MTDTPKSECPGCSSYFEYIRLLETKSDTQRLFDVKLDLIRKAPNDCSLIGLLKELVEAIDRLTRSSEEKMHYIIELHTLQAEAVAMAEFYSKQSNYEITRTGISWMESDKGRKARAFLDRVRGK